MVQNKTVMRLDINGCYKCKKVALHSVTKIEGIDSLSINMKDNTMTVIGEADSVTVANMLRRKFRCAQMISGGPVPPPPPPKKEEKKEEKKEDEKPKEEKKEDKKEEPKKEEKKEEKPKEEENPKQEEKKEEKPKEEEKKEEKKEEEKKEEKKEEAKNPAPVPPAPHQVHPSHPIWCKVCDAQCYPPCSACSSRPEIMWPRYHQPGSGPNEVWYVWNEEKQESCTIM